ncbi:hypothetical protein F5Y13DRAFT_180395 [Hypoxylon sp. FL1857]|nr:hypothetical protein F5Y13DRAFT_180395 [Hypoxylon sp. FL1857]
MCAENTTHRILYVLVYPSRLFAAHWSFWLPYIKDGNRQSDTGDRIHVTGDRLNGFLYEYAAHLSKASQDRNDALGEEGKADIDNAVFNAFDKACREVSAPGPSLNKVGKADTSKVTIPLKQAEVRDCQWWIKEATSHLVRTGILLSLDEEHEKESPASRVDSLPRH